MATTSPTRNFLVPADGSTHCVRTDFTLAPGVAQVFSWKTFSLDNFKFYPQGAYVDNTAGTADVLVTVNPIGYTFRIPAGSNKSVQYPAPAADQTISITGNGNVRVFWVDYPTFPDVDLQALNFSGSSPLPVTVGNSPVVQVAQLAIGNVPYASLAASAIRTSNTYVIAVTNVATAQLQLTGAVPVLRVRNIGVNSAAIVLGNTGLGAPAFPAAGANGAVELIAANETRYFDVSGFAPNPFIRTISDVAGGCTLWVSGHTWGQT